MMPSTLARTSLLKFNSLSIRSLASGPASGLAPRSPSRGGFALRSPLGLPASGRLSPSRGGFALRSPSGLPASGRLSPSRGGLAGPALRSPSGLPPSGLPASGLAPRSPSRGGPPGPAFLFMS